MSSAQREAACVRLDERVALRPVEAARVLGISLRKLRELLPDLPHFRAGGVVLIPVDSLKDWAREKARAGPSQVDATVAEILDNLKNN